MFRRKAHFTARTVLLVPNRGRFAITSFVINYLRCYPPRKVFAIHSPVHVAKTWLSGQPGTKNPPNLLLGLLMDVGCQQAGIRADSHG